MERLRAIPVDLSEMPLEAVEDYYFAINSLAAAQQLCVQEYGEGSLAVWIVGWSPDD